MHGHSNDEDDLIAVAIHGPGADNLGDRGGLWRFENAACALD